MFELDKKIVIKFYEDMRDGDVLVWFADKEYEVQSVFNDAFIIPCEISTDLNYGVSPSEAGIKFDVYRR